MRIIVCGSRDAKDHRPTWAALDELVPKPTLVVTGCAQGVDRHALSWAISNGVPNAKFQAAWGKYGKKAGPIRNRWMMEFIRPHLVLAMPGDDGTASMMKIATEWGVEVLCRE